jgi:ketosteroid isomerase-like protein
LPAIFAGRQSVLEYLQRALDLTSGTQQVVPVDLLTGDEHVAALVDVTAHRRGLSLNDRAIQLLGFRDDRIIFRRLYPADQAAFDRFWTP